MILKKSDSYQSSLSIKTKYSPFALFIPILRAMPGPPFCFIDNSVELTGNIT